jgi:hypothetical protein
MLNWSINKCFKTVIYMFPWCRIVKKPFFPFYFAPNFSFPALCTIAIILSPKLAFTKLVKSFAAMFLLPSRRQLCRRELLLRMIDKEYIAGSHLVLSHAVHNPIRVGKARLYQSDLSKSLKDHHVANSDLTCTFSNVWLNP